MIEGKLVNEFKWINGNLVIRRCIFDGIFFV